MASSALRGFVDGSFSPLVCIISCLIFSFVLNMPTRKDLWFSFRSSYPKLAVRQSDDFKAAIHETLITLFKFSRPLTLEWHDFITEEVINFGNVVPRYWIKAGRHQRGFLKKHSKYFAKTYPFEVQEIPPSEPLSPPPDLDLVEPVPLKRPYESKSRSQQCRDRAKLILHNDDSVLIEAASDCFKKQGYKDAAFVVKRLRIDPDIGSELRKTIDTLGKQDVERLIYIFIHFWTNLLPHFL